MNGSGICVGEMLRASVRCLFFFFFKKNTGAAVKCPVFKDVSVLDAYAKTY